MQLDEYIRIEQTAAIYKNLKLILLGTFSVTLATFLMFWSGDFDRQWLALWMVSVCILLLFRWLSSLKFDPKKLAKNRCQYWLNLSLFWSHLAGIHWGLVPLFLLEGNVTIYTLFCSFVLTGYTASAISTNAAYPPAFIAFAFPASIMYAVHFALQGDLFHSAMAFMIMFFFVVSCMLSRNAHRLFREARELNFKNMALMEDLIVQKEAAENATLSKDKFLAAASHDLRQPLHSAGLLLSALDQYVSDDQGKSILNDIHQSNDALNHSFNSLLDVSRLDAGVVVAGKTHVNLELFLAPIIREYEMLAAKKGLAFEVNGGSAFAYTDPIIFERILHNLLSNAVNYTESGSVSLSWEQLSNGRIRVLVQDSGIGIHGNDLYEIFSEYFQINNPERDRNKGFGLGLAIVKRLCEILDVQLCVCSEVGVGSTFAFYLDQGKELTSRREEGKAPLQFELKGTCVLIIDDDLGVIRGMETLLSSWGCEVICAESEGLAIQRLVDDDIAPNIVIADYRLRDSKTGVEAVQRVLDEINHEIPAIIITGDTSPDRLKELTESGFPVLHKPVSPALLRSAIQRKLLRR